MNYIDVYVRKGVYPMVTPPAVIGMEAAGVVVDVGPGVAHLLHRTCRIRPGATVLVHGAAGGLGLMLCRWATYMGARVIGTVSSDDKTRQARSSGCELTIVTGAYRFAEQVGQATAGRGVDVIFDGLGREAFQENLASIAICGQWVSYGEASGAMESVSLALLSSKSVTFSRPVLFHYNADRTMLREISGNVFNALRDDAIQVDVRHRYPLAAAAQAHADLESRKTSGQLVLLP